MVPFWARKRYQDLGIYFRAAYLSLSFAAQEQQVNPRNADIFVLEVGSSVSRS